MYICVHYLQNVCDVHKKGLFYWFLGLWAWDFDGYSLIVGEGKSLWQLTWSKENYSKWDISQSVLSTEFWIVTSKLLKCPKLFSKCSILLYGILIYFLVLTGTLYQSILKNKSKSHILILMFWYILAYLTDLAFLLTLLKVNCLVFILSISLWLCIKVSFTIYS